MKDFDHGHHIKMRLGVVPTECGVRQNCPVFCPNLASEWIAGQFQHVEEKNLAKFGGRQQLLLLSLFMHSLGRGSRVEGRRGRSTIVWSGKIVG